MSFRTHDSQKMRNNLPDYWLWQRCSDLSARKAIVAWDAEERILWGSSWSLPAAPSEIPPPSCSHSATEKNSRNSSSSSYYPIILLHIYIIFIENRKLYLRWSRKAQRTKERTKEGRKEGRNASGWFHVCHVPRSFTVKHGYQMSRFWNGCEPATRYVVTHTHIVCTYVVWISPLLFPRFLPNLGTERNFYGRNIVSKFRNDYRRNETTIKRSSVLFFFLHREKYTLVWSNLRWTHFYALRLSFGQC